MSDTYASESDEPIEWVAAVTIVYDTAPVRPDFDDPAGPGR